MQGTRGTFKGFGVAQGDADAPQLAILSNAPGEHVASCCEGNAVLVACTQQRCLEWGTGQSCCSVHCLFHRSLPGETGSKALQLHVVRGMLHSMSGYVMLWLRDLESQMAWEDQTGVSFWYVDRA